MAEGRWPDFFIVGAPKAGTTTLYEHLVVNPRICIPVKEAHHFDAGIDRSVFFTRVFETEIAYRRLFATCPADALAGDGTPTYLVDPTSAGAIAAVVPEAKIIVLIRDPVDRAISHFRFREERVGRNDRDFATAIETSRAAPVSNYADSYLIQAGHYAAGLERFIARFGRQDVHVAFFEELVTDPEPVVRSVTEFLGLEFTGLAAIGWRQQNAAARPRGTWASAVLQSATVRSVARRLPNGLMQRLGRRLLLESAGSAGIDEDIRRLLQREYRDEAAAIERLVGRRPPWSWVNGSQSAG